ncbi:ABC transporter substrate-binding protein [Paenibacillus sp. FSL H7-0714]|uniref:ABC transporter substrate-binding protein n=1 Tax=Paenibacillus sp. FSL H7-0714 TaxID=2954735 RepID=UPI0030F96B2F
MRGNQARKHKFFSMCAILVMVTLAASFFITPSTNGKVTINIGYQSITAQTWGALIIKHQHLFEKKLKARYPYIDFNIQWHDEVSGSVINNNMLAHKYQIGYMGDMPSIINLYNGYLHEEYNSRLLAIDGKGLNGKNQSILVSQESGINDIHDLAGRTISVPIASSTHKMLLDILAQNDLLDKVEIINQDIPTAYNMITTGKIQALAAWEPYPSYLMQNDQMIRLMDGEVTGNDYLAGIMIDDDWAKKNSEYTSIFLDSIKESHEFLRNNPDESVKIISQESGFPPDVIANVLKNIDWEMEITSSNRDTLKKNYEFLYELGFLKDFPVEAYLNTVKGKN